MMQKISNALALAIEAWDAAAAAARRHLARAREERDAAEGCSRIFTERK